MPFLFNNANMYIDQYNGIIGVGTSTPSANLHVIGSSVITGNLSASSLTITGTGLTGILSTSTQPNITSVGTLTNIFVNNGFNVSSTGNVGVGIGTAISNSNIHVQGTSKFLSSTGSTGIHVSSLGNVGIGTATPNANLHVMGYTQILGTTGTGGMFIDTVGEVGINTSNPTSNLHVLGTTQILGATGSTGMYVSTLGNVGIGISTPNANLHVIGSAFILGNVSTGFTVNTTGNVGIGTTIANANLHVLGHARLLGISGSTGMYISNIGNVGIGTAFPMANLHVLGNSQILGSAGTTGLYISNTGNVGIGTSVPNGNLHILGYSQILGSGGSTGMYISNIGNVGIGTAFPMANLHVLGNSQLLSLVGTTGLYISNTGNVGIGTSVPTGNLHVLGYTQILNPTGTNGIYVATTGNVGIGSTNPQYNLDIIGTMRCSNVAIFQGLAIQNSTFGAALGMDVNNHCCLQLTANASTTSLYSYIDFSNIGNDYFGRILYDNLTHNLQFHTKTTERMRIDTNGNVGINTGTPLANLHVFTGLTTLPASGSVAANIGGPLTILHGSNDGFNRFISALDTNMSTSTRRSIVWGQSASAYNQAELFFNYIGSSSTSNYISIGLYAIPSVYITGAGYVGIGTTNPSYPLYVLTAGTTYGGTSRNYFGASTTTSIGTNGSASTNVSAVFQGDVINVAGNYVAYSDLRIKKDIISLDTNYCLELLTQLRVVEHDYIDKFKYPKKKINFIAQEVQDIIPLAVETVEDFLPSIFGRYSYNKITNTTYLILDIHFDFIEVDTKLKILTEKEEFITTVINLTQDTITIKTEKELVDEIFVYGHQIEDCRTLNNDTLYTICIGAVQENNKRIKNLEQKIVILEEKIDKLL